MTNESNYSQQLFTQICLSFIVLVRVLHSTLVSCMLYVHCILCYKGKLENNRVFVQLYTKFYDFNMYAAAQNCVVISHVHTYMLLYK